MKYFNDCATVEQVKSRYRDLMQQYHPDHGGSEDITKAINSELDTVLANIMGGAYTSSGRQDHNFSADSFGDILGKIIDLDVTIEIIGFWIYVFDSYQVKDTLKALGFWFSKKHKAWIYSGGRKLKVRTMLTTDDNRARLGSEIVKRKSAPVRIA